VDCPEARSGRCIRKPVARGLAHRASLVLLLLALWPAGGLRPDGDAAGHALQRGEHDVDPHDLFPDALHLCRRCRTLHPAPANDGERRRKSSIAGSCH